MGDCELCGAMKVGTRSVMRGQTSIEACKQCMQRMGIALPEENQNSNQRPLQHTKPKQTVGYRGTGKKGKDIMVRRSKELRSDFSSAIRQAREAMGWDQRELAKRMAERVNIIQHSEGGKRPTDSVVNKFERILNIQLMVERTTEEETIVRNTKDRQMTMEDLYNQAKKDMRGD